MPSTRSHPHPLGVHPCAAGAEVAVFASSAEAVEFCLLDRDSSGEWRERRTPLPHHRHGVWFGTVPDVRPGQRYGLRAHGPWDPARGLRFNPAKLLLDPYARAHSGTLRLRPELFGHTVDDRFVGDTAVPDPRDSAPHAPHGIVVGAGALWGADEPPDIPWSDTVIYEAHVSGLTRRLPGVPEPLRGTYAGLAHDATLDYLTGLGVTAVELLPVQAIGTEPALARRGRVNYWGYSTLGFFAPHPGYAAATDPLAVLEEFRHLVRRLHGAGLELILDVVLNHTCETDETGPTLSWRGLDAPAYYLLDDRGRHWDTTGCGNSLNARHPRVVQMMLDSLRYWVESAHVDGFRFDLAPTLARGRDGFDPDHPFLVAARADPVLQRVKLIAEPWDVGPRGWRTGQFPPPFAEWNDRFRDTARHFWLSAPAGADPGDGIRALATRLAGSDDLFSADRGPLASVNFITAHDGFTLADLTAYDRKHNEENGEQGRDGSDLNLSWNHGTEGATTDPDILAARRRSARNLLGTLLLSAGVPMLVAGDERGRTQGGNNNPYCVDGPTTWLDWHAEASRTDLTETVRFLLALRRDHPVLRQERSFADRVTQPDGSRDIVWFGDDGRELGDAQWSDPRQRIVQLLLTGPDEGSGTGSVLLVVQGSGQGTRIRLPEPPGRQSWYRLLWDSVDERPGPARNRPVEPAGTVVTVAGPSVRVYAVLRDGTGEPAGTGGSGVGDQSEFGG
jgi:glycogen operon protein